MRSEARKVIQRESRRYIQKYASEIRAAGDILLWDGAKSDLELVARVQHVVCVEDRTILTVEYIYLLTVQTAHQGFLSHDKVVSVDFERHIIVTRASRKSAEELFVLLKRSDE